MSYLLIIGITFLIIKLILKWFDYTTFNMMIKQIRTAKYPGICHQPLLRCQMIQHLAEQHKIDSSLVEELLITINYNFPDIDATTENCNNVYIDLNNKITKMNKLKALI